MTRGVAESQTHRIVLRGPKRCDLMRGEVSLGEFESLKLAGEAAAADGVGPDVRIPVVDTYPNWFDLVDGFSEEASALPDADVLARAMFAFRKASMEAGSTMICQRWIDQHHWDASDKWAADHQKGLAWFQILMDRVKEAERVRADDQKASK